MVELNAIVDGVAASGVPYTKKTSLAWVTKQQLVYKCLKKHYTATEGPHHQGSQGQLGLRLE